MNAVAPGFIDTDMTRELPEAQREALLGQIPLGRLGQAEEIAKVVGFRFGRRSLCDRGHRAGQWWDVHELNVTLPSRVCHKRCLEFVAELQPGY